MRIAFPYKKNKIYVAVTPKARGRQHWFFFKLNIICVLCTVISKKWGGFCAVYVHVMDALVRSVLWKVLTCSKLFTEQNGHQRTSPDK